MKRTYKVTDTVVYNRQWFVTAETEDEAIAIVEDGAVDWDTLQFSEIQDGDRAEGYSAIPLSEDEDEGGE